MLKRAAILMGVMCFSVAAFADQCAWNDNATAQAGKRLLPKGAEVVHFMVGGSDSPIPETVTKSAVATIRSSGEIYKEVQINGRGIDLAYVYVKTAPNTYLNVARAAGCKGNNGRVESAYTLINSSGKKLY